MRHNIFSVQAYNNAWANFRLLSACQKLSRAEFDQARTSFFPSLKATLNHNLCVDWFYVDALEGGSLGPAAFADDEPCSTAQELEVEQRAVDQRLIDHCTALSPDAFHATIRINRGKETQKERTDRLLLHLFQHQIHHRGQAHAMLAGTRVKPPQLDEFLMSGDRAFRDRADDMAVLGWTEEMIWGG